MNAKDLKGATVDPAVQEEAAAIAARISAKLNKVASGAKKANAPPHGNLDGTSLNRRKMHVTKPYFSRENYGDARSQPYAQRGKRCRWYVSVNVA